MITLHRCLVGCLLAFFLIAAAACGSSASRKDAATGGPEVAKDLACTGQACADLPAGASETAPADLAPDRGGGMGDLTCTGPGCADSPPAGTDAGPGGPADAPPDPADGNTPDAADAVLDRADGNPSDVADTVVDRADGSPPNPSDTARDRADGDPPNPSDAQLDRADDRRDSPAEGVVACSADAKPECVKGWVNYLDGGVCYPTPTPVEPRCMGGVWSCPPGESVPKSTCTEHVCEGDRPSGACSPGDTVSCWGYPSPVLYPNVHLTCSCVQGTWSCLY
jgi:hypothetical protein